MHTAQLNMIPSLPHCQVKCQKYLIFELPFIQNTVPVKNIYHYVSTYLPPMFTKFTLNVKTGNTRYENFFNNHQYLFSHSS